jgi:hypothetical protein
MDQLTKRALKEHCPNAPWCQDEPEDIARAVLGLMHDHEPFIKQWAYKWYENCQFVYGNHHMKWSKRYGVAVDVDFMRSGNRAINARSKTNVTRVCAEALGAHIYSSTPEWEVNAVDESSTQSTRWGKIGSAILDAQIKIQEMHTDLRQAANSFVTYGQIAAMVDWDNTSGEVIEIPQYAKTPSNVLRSGLRREPFLGSIMDTVTPAMGSDGQPLQSQGWQIVTDEDGMPVKRKVHLGRPRVTFLTPFEYRRDACGGGIHKSKYIQRVRLIDFDDWVREYGQMEGKTEFYNLVIPQNMSGSVQQFATMHFLRLNMITPISDDYWRQSGYSFTDYLRRKILVIEHWDRPTEEWPNGRRVVVANGHTTHVCTPQFKTNKVGGWHPFLEAQWFTVLPSPVAIGPLHDVVDKNKQLNTTDGLIATSLLRNFGSHLLIKAGGGLDPQKITGTPGEIHEVADPNTVARWLHDTSPIPAAIGPLREEFKGDTYEVSGAGDALRGQRTVAASSGYAYRQAQEREEKRLTPPRKEWNRFVGGIGEKVLACMKSNCIKLGDDVIGYLKREAAGKFTIQEAVAFIATPMNFGVDVNVVEGSMEMKSRATTQANYLELNAKTPLGARLANDASVLDKFLKVFDAHHLRDKSAAHRDRVQRENEVFADILAIGPSGKAEDMPVVWAQDDHDIHIADHAEWMIKNDYELSKSQWVFAQITLHIEQHRIQQRELQGQVPIGTTDLVPQMMANVGGAPQAGGVIMEKQQMDAQQAQQAANAPQQPQQQPKPQPTQGGPKAPAGPTNPAPAGSGGPPQTSTGTAPQNTPTGRGQV